jgi:THAP domain-containing protein 4
MVAAMKTAATTASTLTVLMPSLFGTGLDLDDISLAGSEPPVTLSLQTVSRHPEVAELVAGLVGVWTGAGEGQYPTIESFRYREMTAFSERPDHPALHFDQRTWKQTPEGEAVSHWETGLLRISSDGTVRLHDAQPGRVEAMAGTWARQGSGWEISLSSVGYAGDDRVVTTSRTFRLNPGELTYEMQMETTSTGELSLHLSARLQKNRT